MYQYIHMTFFIFKLTNLHSQMNLKSQEFEVATKVSVNFFPLPFRLCLSKVERDSKPLKRAQKTFPDLSSHSMRSLKEMQK